MLFSSFKNLVSFFRQSDRGLTESNISNQFCKPVVGLCALLCMSLWISAAQAQTMRTELLSAPSGSLIPASAELAGYTEAANLGDEVTVDNSITTLVDWVEVQIRVVAQGATEAPEAAPTDAALVYTKAAWLLSDGSVVDADSATVVACTATPADDCTLTIPTGDDGLTYDENTQDLYIVINHRNHLTVMSAGSVEPTSGEYVYDFSAAEDTARGAPLTLLNRGAFFNSGIYAVYAGKIDSLDNAINFLDDGPAIVTNDNAGGYQVSDLNMNGTVNFLDENPFIINNNNTASPIVY